MPGVLITGSNRGLGLEWVRQCAARAWRVHATCRDPDAAAALQDLASRHPDVRLHRLDVTAADQIAGVAEVLRDETLDLLVNNAGVYFEHWGKDPIGSIDFEDWEETFRVNTLGPMRVTEALVAQIARGDRPLVLELVDRYIPDMSGAFFRDDGTGLPW